MEKMPNSFKGKVYKKSVYLKTNPREWTIEETEYLILLNESGYSNKEIADSMDRSEVSVSVKLKRLGKKNNKYDSKHALEKAYIEDKFISQIKPNSILSLIGSSKKIQISSVKKHEIFNNVNSSFGESALKIVAKMYIDNITFDYVDLDTFSSSYEAFDIAIKIAKKGIAITLGEMGHKRWKRLDFVERYYGIDNFNNFTMDNLIEHIQKIGLRNKVSLNVIDKKEWNNVARVWFEIEPIKVLNVQFNNEKSDEKKVKKPSVDVKKRTLFNYFNEEEEV